ncbi:hypothetical protein [Streptomyces sp. NPDC048663]|uniref:hypothetical protein n=1 Tax=Streptomyces sp. NPDC048663 TaxID=3155638 RepID=UPI003446B239
MRVTAPALSEPPDAEQLLVSALSGTVRRTGATAGFLYLLDGAGQTLVMAVFCGLPEDVARPWHHVPLATPAPVTEVELVES